MIYCFSEICRLWVCSSWSTDNEYQGLTVISGIDRWCCWACWDSWRGATRLL